LAFFAVCASFIVIVVDHALDAVSHQFDIPIQQKAKTAIAELEVGQQLSLVNGKHLINRFILDDDTVFHKHVNTVTGVNLLTLCALCIFAV
jgi:hypothetical protein